MAEGPPFANRPHQKLNAKFRAFTWFDLEKISSNLFPMSNIGCSLVYLGAALIFCTVFEHNTWKTFPRLSSNVTSKGYKAY